MQKKIFSTAPTTTITPTTTTDITIHFKATTMSSQFPPPSQEIQADDSPTRQSSTVPAMDPHPGAEEQPAMEPRLGTAEQDQPKRKKKVHLRDDEKKALLVKQCCFHFELYLAGKEVFYREMQKIFEQKTGIDVNVKSFLQNRVPERRREVAKDLEKSGVACHFGDFELAIDQWISLIDSATEKAAADKAAKKDQVSGALRQSRRILSNTTTEG